MSHDGVKLGVWRDTQDGASLFPGEIRCLPAGAATKVTRDGACGQVAKGMAERGNCRCRHMAGRQSGSGALGTGCRFRDCADQPTGSRQEALDARRRAQIPALNRDSLQVFLEEECDLICALE